MKSIISLKNDLSILGIAIFFPIAVISCNSGTAQLTASAFSSTEHMVADAKVVIEHMAYNPAVLTVAKGTKVTWTDKQAIMPHSVTSDIKGLFNSGNMYRKDVFSHTFNTTGTFTYYCTHHKRMHGKVIVK